MQESDIMQGNNMTKDEAGTVLLRLFVVVRPMSLAIVIY